MAFSNFKRVLMAIAFSALFLNGQQTPDAAAPSARNMLDLSDSEVVSFVAEMIDQGFPDERADQMTMLIINRSALVLPLIGTRVAASLKSESPSSRFVDIGSEMIAYAGDEVSIREISKLIAIDEQRFGRLVGRTLDNAGTFRNPFTSVYSAFELDDAAISRYTAEWVHSASQSNRMQRLWAEAMLDRYHKIPDGPEWYADPIASALKAIPDLQNMRQNLLRFATESQERKR
jgi:hypothetical protein